MKIVKILLRPAIISMKTLNSEKHNLKDALKKNLQDYWHKAHRDAFKRNIDMGYELLSHYSLSI